MLGPLRIIGSSALEHQVNIASIVKTNGICREREPVKVTDLLMLYFSLQLAPKLLKLELILEVQDINTFKLVSAQMLLGIPAIKLQADVAIIRWNQTE